jgi:hypothetical protein
MSNWTPSIVSSGGGETVYLVLDDFGDLGRVWRETDFETAADLETVISDLLKGEYANPVRVIGFNHRRLVSRCLRRCRQRIAVPL